MPVITPFLMFTGQAEAAMNYYVSLFPNSAVTSISRVGEGENGVPGSIRHARFTLNGQQFMCIDSAAVHEFTFTPALSLHVQLADEHDVDRLFAALAQDGQVLMPLAAYPFARRYGWCSDRYGVAWQLSHGAVDLR